MSAAALCLGLLSLPFEVSSYYCDGGHYCATAKECCEDGCCYTYPLQRPSPPTHPPYRSINIFVYNHWYFWCVVCALSALVGCAWWAWRRRASLCGSCCRSMARRSRASDHDSAGSCYVPPHYSRCGSFQRAPPPYNEVTSKPDLYPLVITYGDSGDKGGGGNYLMVHYFRNYIIRPPGSVSATSTADSLNSSFICSATNEANSIIPPPYSCAGNFDEWRGGGGGAAAARPAMLRSHSTMTYASSSENTPPPLRIDDAPDVHTAIVTDAFPGLIRLDSSPEPIDNRIFRQSLLRTASRLAMQRELGEPPPVDHMFGDFGSALSESVSRTPGDPKGPRLGLSPEPIDNRTFHQSLLRTASRLAMHRENGELPSMEHLVGDFGSGLSESVSHAPGGDPKRPRLGLSPEPTERSLSPPQACDSEIVSWRQMYESWPCANEERSSSPPRPTSPTMDAGRRQAAKRASKVRQSSLYMPLSSTQGRSRISPGTETQGRSFAQRAFSISAPTTPCGAGLVPTLLTLSQRMSGSVFSSRSSRLTREESDPLLEGEERPDSDAQIVGQARRTDGPF